ncbi:MAG: hypothetical protein Q7S89_00190 [bacterium]|nr:hypothetical protein [bacterium]
MAIEVKRQRGESFDSHFRRFQRITLKSGLKKKLQGKRFRLNTKSRNVQRQSALARLDRKTHMEYLRKIGRLDEMMKR